MGAGAMEGKVSVSGVGVIRLSGGLLAGASSGWNGGELREEATAEVKGELKDERVVPSEAKVKSSASVEGRCRGRMSSMSDCELEDAGKTMTGVSEGEMGVESGYGRGMLVL